MKNNDLFALKKFIEDLGIELKEEIMENTEIEYITFPSFISLFEARK